MQLTYIFHSGFALEGGQCVVVFDYWLDPAGVARRLLAAGKPLYVLASHFHEDHFCRDVFAWREAGADVTCATGGPRRARPTRGWPRVAAGTTDA